MALLGELISKKLNNIDEAKTELEKAVFRDDLDEI